MKAKIDKLSRLIIDARVCKKNGLDVPGNWHLRSFSFMEGSLFHEVILGLAKLPLKREPKK